jgi:hypothetical protein
MSERTPDDAEWERIVASLRGPDTEGSLDWPDAENAPERSAADEATDPVSADPEPGQPDEPVIIWRGSTEDIEAEIERAVPDEHFVPPEPPPLPRADAITWAAWVGAIGAPLLLVLLTALGVSSGFVVVGAVAAFLGGVAILVSRMSSHRDPFDPDDGAVV